MLDGRWDAAKGVLFQSWVLNWVGGWRAKKRSVNILPGFPYSNTFLANILA